MTAVLLGLWLALLVSKGTPIGDLLHRKLVATPAAWFSRWTRGQVMMFGGLVMMAVIGVLILGRDSVVLVDPLIHGLTLLSSIEVTAYVDALIAVTTAASILRVGQAVRWVRVRLLHSAAHRRAVRARRSTSRS